MKNDQEETENNSFVLIIVKIPWLALYGLGWIYKDTIKDTRGLLQSTLSKTKPNRI